MRKSLSKMKFRYLAPLAALLTAACAGGGGGYSPATTQMTAGTTTTTAAQNLLPNGSFNLNVPAGPIAAPPTTTFGTGTKQIATPGGATFDGTVGGYATSGTFPLAAVSMQSGATSGLVAVTGNPAASATIISNSAHGSSLQLVVPSVNLNTTINSNVDIVFIMDTPTWGESYVALGSWQQNSSGAPLLSHTAFMFGFETPITAMPTSGSANYAGYSEATVFKSNGANVYSNYVTGTATMSANFANGQVTGSITQMRDNSNAAWNDVSLNASIAAGTNRFSGTAAAASAPGTPFSLAGTATGHVDGGFYGLTAQNVGAIWSLSDGNVSAVGTVWGK